MRYRGIWHGDEREGYHMGVPNQPSTQHGPANATFRASRTRSSITSNINSSTIEALAWYLSWSRSCTKKPGPTRSEWGTRSELYNWITAPCLRKAFLQFLAVSEQFSVFPKGTCCCRCSERDRDGELIFPAIGYEGLCNLELEKNRIEATKAARKEARKWKTPDKLRDRVI